jgi:hypothetical protein
VTPDLVGCLAAAIITIPCVGVVALAGMDGLSFIMSPIPYGWRHTHVLSSRTWAVVPRIDHYRIGRYCLFPASWKGWRLTGLR